MMMAKNKAETKARTQVPTLSFKNAFLLMLYIFIIFTIGMTIIEYIPRNMLLVVITLLSLVIGYGIGFIQEKIQNKKKLGKAFLWLGGVFSVLAFVMLFGIYYAAVLF
ncbi:MAG: hypothetical protein ACTHYF_05455 [Ruoffia tabacinasalis]|uniref:DUF4190 domain-containing protein n=1 Tax=Ruoffia tabacinasalis TaxID=87458 RepID=A0ABS0LL72_9LACT|nr:hypothetical protein [Ruoffia tabacinasalis]MBG9979036.1 hypothetical protein [Ruoffia tabacinasalis]